MTRPLRGAVVQSLKVRQMRLRCSGRLRDRVGGQLRIGQHHAAEADDVGPAVAHDVLRHVRQVFLQVTVGGADEEQDFGQRLPCMLGARA